MLDEPLEIFSRQRLLNELSEKGLVFFIMLVAQTVLQMFAPFVVGYVIDMFGTAGEAPYVLIQYAWLIVNIIFCGVMIILGLQSNIPGAIFIGLIAIQTLLFSCILFLLSYTIKYLAFHEEQ
jgi:hypothetical protein